MMAKWYAGPWGPKASWHLSYRWEKTQKKTSPRKLVPNGDRTRARCVTSAHATTCSTAVDLNLVLQGDPSSVTPMNWLLFVFWGDVCNPHFITCDDRSSNSFTVIMASLQKCQCWLHALCFVFWCQLLCPMNSKLYHRPHFTIGVSWNKSHHLQPLQRCCCEHSRSPASACVMRRYYSIMYTQSLHAINGLLAVGRVGNLVCGRSSYIL